MTALALDGQVFTAVSIAIILILSAILSIFLTTTYLAKKTSSYASWSIGLWLFTFAVLEEFLFSFGIYSQFLIRSYLAAVAILVQVLAIGSLQLFGQRRPLVAYYVYSATVTIVLFAALYTATVGDIISSYVVYGGLPLAVMISSSLVTFPAAAILVAVAAISFHKTHNWKMISIIAGVVVVSIAGTLYIAKFPVFLYYAEFGGILLLWAGFYTPRKAVNRSGHPDARHNAGR